VARTQAFKEMTDNDNNNQIIIYCPFCMEPITVDELGEHVNANPDTKKHAIEEQLLLWGELYDRNYLIQNVVFCPNCGKVSHLDYCTSASRVA
jgi:hypothetical protein